MLNSILLHSNSAILINRFQDEASNLPFFKKPVKGSFHSRYYPYNQSAHMEPSTGVLYYHLSKDLREICKYQSHHFPGMGSKDIVLLRQKTLLSILAHICRPCCVTRAHAHLGAFDRAACLSLYEILLVKKSLLWGRAEASRCQCCYVISSVVDG